MKKKSAKALVLMLLVCVLTLTVASFAPQVNAENPTIQCNPSIGQGGTSVNLFGFGFVPNLLVTVKFSNTQVATTTSSPTGSISCSFQVPSSVQFGSYTVTATDGQVLASAPFTVTAAEDQTLRLNPTFGKVGDSIKLYAYGFAQGSLCKIRFENTEILRNYANDSGTLEMTIQVPALTAGQHTVSVTDASGTSASTQFTITTIIGYTTTTGQPSQSASAAPTSNPFQTQTPSISFKPSTATPKPGESFWNNTTLGIVAVAVVIAIIVPLALFYRRGSGRKDLLSEEETSNAQQPAAPAYPSAPAASRYQSSTGSRYGQSPSSSSNTLLRPTFSTSRPTATSRYAQPTTAMRNCPRCNHPIRSDYSICPYCHKRLK